MEDVTMKNNVAFETKLSFLDRIFAVVQFVFCFSIFIVFCIKAVMASDFVLIYVSTVFVFMAFSGLWKAKTFHLHQDRLVVRRPLLSFLKKDEQFFLADFKEAAFKRIKGRFGGPMLCIKTKRVNEDYRIDLSDAVVTEFVLKLQQAGLKVRRENI